ncbi:periplasmic sensor signal transduction histidine kinase [Dehalobacter sp. UNSWDHB]|jgi:Signal transduction histidine kinase|uniref:sensor histidine kinase n=1 Tax=unclassified Dehalobacter TaxID=2635733 RepID=UPI00028B889E|nr:MULTISPECIES: HAMP domain-containing sensor histidine kinase [unclassified Dehalobacter]AFV03760.1 periplasmic sensor signal transduction histidine kinase [Dehalobacter sp. DCA]AFV06746.1 periplasmic sensor signal transduction histidine kinase [Dehalobacter sp. CF]EQB20237.1 periplasmic sensor signal transduction histidine kinase [Dehalobacter sp. UNSWDHB]
MVKKTIFSKLFFTYLILIIAVMAVIAVLLSYAFNNYVFGEKQQEMRAAAAETVLLLGKYEQAEITYSELNDSLDILGSMTGSRIYAIRLNPEVLANKNLVLDKELLDAYLFEDLKSILQGKEVSRKKQYSDRFAADVAFLGVPYGQDNMIEGAILFFAPLDEIYAYIQKINMIIWCSALAAVILSGIMIYLAALKITKPLKIMEEGAIQLAAGEQINDLAVHSGDELEKMAKAFNNMKNQISTAENMRRDFMASVSHDLRTPLTSINGFVQGMLDGLVKPQDYPKYLNIIKTETNRLMGLTGEILESAKIQSGEITLARKYFLVGNTLEEILESTGMRENPKNIELMMDCPDGLELYADQYRFKQILINILDNALKYTGKNGKIKLTITPEDGGIKLSVQDNGKGIAPQDLPFIFEKFYRADKSRQEVEGGTGLGLNITKMLVEQHGGRISASSTYGQGTEIVIFFPG